MTEDSISLVFYAAKSGDIDTIKENFDQCDILIDELGNTPLHWSASAGHLGMYFSNIKIISLILFLIMKMERKWKIKENDYKCIN